MSNNYNQRIHLPPGQFPEENLLKIEEEPVPNFFQIPNVQNSYDDQSLESEQKSNAEYFELHDINYHFLKTLRSDKDSQEDKDRKIEALDEAHVRGHNDQYQKQIEDGQQNSREIDELDRIRLKEFLKMTRENENASTKNVLRNFFNAQRQYCFHHPQARKIIKKNISNPESFHKWLNTLSYKNFKQFSRCWVANEEDGTPRLFARVYKQICWNFYSEQAIPYVLTSRIQKQEVRKNNLRTIYKFLEGIQSPEDFVCFRYF